MGKEKQLTNEKFLENLNKRFPNLTYNILGVYTGHKSLILVEGKYGKCLMKGNSLYNGSSPSIKSAIDRNDYAVKELKEKHNNFYTYEKFIYKTAKTLTIITCPIHGDFEQTFDVHRKGHGCKKCDLESRVIPISVLIERLNKVHNNLYDYSKVKNTNHSEKIEIICRIHGIFLQSINSHSRGQGCPKCYNEVKGWSKTDFINITGKEQATFYIIKCWNENEEFYKTGKTKNTIKRRFKGKHEMPYNYEIIKEIKSFDAGWIFDLEIKSQRLLINFKYKPKIKFDGVTECFSNVKLLLSDIENNNF